jgi:hypothetical protein
VAGILTQEGSGEECGGPVKKGEGEVMLEGFALDSRIRWAESSYF